MFGVKGMQVYPFRSLRDNNENSQYILPTRQLLSKVNNSMLFFVVLSLCCDILN